MVEIHKRSPIEYSLLKAHSKVERSFDIARYEILSGANQMIGHTDALIRRKRQLLIPLIVKNREVLWYGPQTKGSEKLNRDIEHHAMPYYVLKRYLSRIPREEIEGKKVLDLFSGHGAVGFSVATGGLSGDVFPKQMLMLDNAYNPIWPPYRIYPHLEASTWQIRFIELLNRNNPYYHDRPGIYNPIPEYLAADGSRIPLDNGSIDTVIADPPFGVLTKVADPMGLMMGSLHEVRRILKPRGTAYYLMPWEWTTDIIGKAPMHGQLLKKNIGRTWFDISVVKFTHEH